MVRRVVKKLNIPFQLTFDMWSAIYGRYEDDGDFRSNYIDDEIQKTINSKDVIKSTGLGDKKTLTMYRAVMIKDYLNTVVISRTRKDGDEPEAVACYPEISTNEYLEATLLEVCEYSSGFEARLKIKIKVDNDFFDQENTLWIFDTRYVINKNKYEIGKSYTFHLGALITSIVHRPKKDLELPMKSDEIIKLKEAFVKSGVPIQEGNDYKYVTHDMFYINPLYADNPEAFFCRQRFTGLHGEELHHPNIPKEFDSYIFHIKSHVIDGKTGYMIPAYFNDVVILLSDNLKINKENLRYEEGDPIDFKGIMQGYIDK